MPRSVRARLTLTIAVLAALLSLSAVWFGSRAVEANLIDEALGDRASLYLDPLTGSFMPAGFAGSPDSILLETDSGLVFEQLVVNQALPADMAGSVVFGRDFGLGEDGTEISEATVLEAMAAFDPELVRAQMVGRLDQGFARLDDAGLLDDITRALDVRAAAPVDIVEGFGIVRYDFVSRSGRLLPTTSTVVALDDENFIDMPWTPVPIDSQLALPMAELMTLTDELIEGQPGSFLPVRVLEDPVLAYRETTSADDVTFGVLAEVSERVASVDQMRESLWLAAGLLTVLAAAATWILTGRALRPVDALTRRVGAISTSTLSERVPVPETEDEIHELATTMNAMLDRIELGDHERRRFVADASHELRTPVAILRSEAEIAQRIPEQTEVADLAGAVLAETDRLGSLVEDLLALARHDEGLRTEEPARNASPQALPPVDLDEVVFEDAARTRQVDFDVSQVSGGRVRGSRDELARTVGHLFDNAARHAANRVVVAVRTDTERGVVVLTVDDDGEGIAPDKRARVFDRFVRLDDARARDKGGAGLGLAVVQSTVQRLGGDVTIRDSPLGGASLLVELPVAEP